MICPYDESYVRVIENWNQMAVNRRAKKAIEPKIPNICEVLKEDQWCGCPCVLLGGGPSLKDVLERLDEFPEKTRFAGVNQSWRLRAEIMYAIDTQVFDLAESTFGAEWREKHEAGQIRITHQATAPKGVWTGTYWVQQISNAEWGKSFSEGIIAANNSGLCALNVVDILGADPIILLGFDGWKKHASLNWHDDYPEGQHFIPNDPAKTCQRWEKNFKAVAQLMRATVLNANPASSYQSFPRVTFDAAVEACQSALKEKSCAL